MPLLLGYLIDLFVCLDPAELDDNGNQLPRQKCTERIDEILISIPRKISENSCIELFLGECRLEVD